MTRIGVAVPVYNAEQSVAEVVRGILARFDALGVCGRIALVDDGSTDDSAQILRELAAVHGCVTAARLDGNQGQQAALLCGLGMLADCDYIVTMDDDLQHPAELIDQLYEAVCVGYDLVYAVPEGERRPLWRRAGSVLRDGLFALCTGKPRGVRVSACRIMTGALAASICAERQGYVYLSASAFRYRPQTACIAYRPCARAFGTSGYNLRRLAGVYWKLMIYYTPVGRIFRPRDGEPPYRIAEIWEGGTSL